ncbi:MAG: ankyrin repeat domain-containing protein [Phycisphaerales bacterium]
MTRLEGQILSGILLLLGSTIMSCCRSVPQSRDATSGVPSVTPDGSPAVVFSLKTWRHGGWAYGSDSPTLALYANRDLIYFNAAKRRYEYVRLTEQEYDRLLEEVVPADLGALDDYYCLLNATSQPFHFFYFGAEPQRVVKLYGDPTRDYRRASGADTYEEPQSLLRCLTTVMAYRNERATVWLPEEIEVWAWYYGHPPLPGKEYDKWPKEWPRLDSPGVTKKDYRYSLFLRRDQCRGRASLLPWAGHDVLDLDGNFMAIAYRTYIPGEEVFDGREDESSDAWMPWDGEERFPGKRSLWLSPLSRAAQAGEIERVRSLIAEGVDANAGEEDGSTPLFWAAFEGHADAVNLLLANGVDINARRQNGNTALHGALFNRKYDLAKFLIANGADPDATTVMSGSTPLHLAADKEDVIEVLLAKGADVNVRCKDGTTPLHLASRMGEKNAVELLLFHGADVNAQDQRGSTPLHSAALRYNSTEVVGVLIDCGGDVNAKAQDGSTPLHCATQQSNPSVAILLIEKGANVNAKDGNGTTPLYHAAFRGQINVVRLLLACGADVDVHGPDGKSPLHMAAEGGRAEIAELLIVHGADVSARTPYENTPLLCALDFRQADVARLLLEKGVDVNVSNNVGNTPLHYSTDDKLKDVVETLIVKGADVEARNRAGDTPLYCAAREGACQIAELLLARGADVDAAKPDGRTALHAAASRGHREIVALLIARGADVNARTKDGQSPLDCARQAGHVDIVSLLHR